MKPLSKWLPSNGLDVCTFTFPEVVVHPDSLFDVQSHQIYGPIKTHLALIRIIPSLNQNFLQAGFQLSPLSSLRFKILQEFLRCSSKSRKILVINVEWGLGSIIPC